MFGAIYIAPPSGIPVGRIVRRCLLEMDWSMKQAALSMGWDEATFSKAINGLAPLDMHKLALLPASFWWKCFREVIAAVLHREETTFEEERRRA